MLSPVEGCNSKFCVRSNVNTGYRLSRGGGNPARGVSISPEMGAQVMRRIAHGRDRLDSRFRENDGILRLKPV